MPSLPYLRVAFSTLVDNSGVMKSSPRTDGRVARGERNTEAIVAALQKLYARGKYSPTVGEVAGLAGVTRRSIYNRFPDIESVAEELANRQLKQLSELFQRLPNAESPLAERVEEFAAQCAELFEQVGPVHRAAAIHAHRSQAIRRYMRKAQVRAAERVTRAFDAELSALSAAERARLQQALTLACSFEAWDRLRTVQKLAIKDAQRVLGDLVLALFSRTEAGTRHSSRRSLNGRAKTKAL